MPRLTTYGLDSELVKKIAPALTEEMANLMNVPREYITIQVNKDTFIQNGQECLGDPFVEVSLFNRGEDSEDALAKLITKHFNSQGCSALDIYLTHLERRRYYENGQHF